MANFIFIVQGSNAYDEAVWALTMSIARAMFFNGYAVIICCRACGAKDDEVGSCRSGDEGDADAGYDAVNSGTSWPRIPFSDAMQQGIHLIAYAYDIDYQSFERTYLESYIYTQQLNLLSSSVAVCRRPTKNMRSQQCRQKSVDNGACN